MSFPNFEKLARTLTDEQLEVLAIIEESDSDLLVEQMETGDIDLFINCCVLSLHNGFNMVEILFEDKEGFFDFCYEVYKNVFKFMNYKTFLKIGQPIGVKINPKMYKEFKEYVKTYHEDEFRNNNIFDAINPEKRKDREGKIEKNIKTDIWNRETEEENNSEE